LITLDKRIVFMINSVEHNFVWNHAMAKFEELCHIFVKI